MMAHRLKTVKYLNADRRILLQNENGPCPLLAAANALLLKGSIRLPPECIRNGVASIDDVVNVLAEFALGVGGDHSFHLHEMLTMLPNLQYGMDVNPRFTSGPMGVEYTSNLTAFEMLGVELVHGWLIDPQDVGTTHVIGNKTYNELIELVIKGKDAESELEKIGTEITELETKLSDVTDDGWVRVKKDPEQAGDEEKKTETTEGEKTTQLSRKEAKKRLEELRKRAEELPGDVTAGAVIDDFFRQSSHQLTHYGLMELYKHLGDESLSVFFRNNHFATITKHCGVLYMLVTDLGYASVSEIMWEKLDVIDGDTEYMSPSFSKAPPQTQLMPPAPMLTPQQLLAQRGQSEADYQLALQISQGSGSESAGANSAEDEAKLVAAATEASLRTYNGVQDETPPGDTMAAAPPATSTTRTTTSDRTQEQSDMLVAMQIQAQETSTEDASLALAERLQAEENQRMLLARAMVARRPAPQRPAERAGAEGSMCVIS